MENVYSPSMVTDPTLERIGEQAKSIQAAIVQLYQEIRDAKDNGYSYNELEAITGFSRGTLQNIAVGRNPRFSID